MAKIAGDYGVPPPVRTATVCNAVNNNTLFGSSLLERAVRGSEHERGLPGRAT